MSLEERAGVEPMHVVQLERGRLSLRLASFGATLLSLEVPDRAGGLADVVLGFDSLDAYRSLAHPYFGGTIGRCANRIGGARFELDGHTFVLSANEGANHLHGGRLGFDRRDWRTELGERGHAVTFVRQSPDGEEGYPGSLDVRATYALGEDRELELSYEAEAHAPTIVDLTHHSYFNLAGGGTILDHELEVRASRTLVVDGELLPTGELASVAGTPFDFREPRRIGERLAELESTPGRGYDVYFVLDEPRRAPPHEPRLACRLTDPGSGRTLELHTTAPGLQLYTGNHLRDLAGKGGRTIPRFGGVCLEPQRFPDAVHHPQFPAVVLRPGERYAEVTRIRFDALPNGSGGSG